MKYIQPFSNDEYFLWKSSATNLPWKRQFLNQEFLKFEKKRINDLSKWYESFRKSEEGKPLEEASFYTIPIELSTTWKGSIANLGNFNFFGLSALQNSPVIPLIALIPYDRKQPKDYRLINIKKGKKAHLFNDRTGTVERVIIIEEWEYLPSDRVYVDVPFEKQIIKKIFKESLVHDDQIASSFQTPIISAPYVGGSIGGVSLSSIAGNSTFTKELVKTIQLMVPPEYRGFNPPERAYKGSKFTYLSGIKFHFAERPCFDNNFLSSVYDTGYKALSDELLNRSKFSGEYSIFSTINPNYGNYTQVWKELLNNFTSTEVTIPQDLDELPEMDVNLFGLKGVINEDLWIQVVHTRQLSPSFTKKANDSFIKTIERVRKDLDTLLADFHKKEVERDYIVRSMLYPMQYNLKRVAQSFARARGKNSLSETEFSDTRNLMVDNFQGFINHPRFEKIKSAIERKKDSARYSIVQTEIMNNPKSTAREIYEAVKSTELFRDIYDLQGFLDWLHKKGFVIVDSEKKYTWVGR